MRTLRGKHVYLRALEPEDLDLVHKIENDENIWEMSSTQVPYSKYLIKQYLQNAQQDIYEAKQLRLVVSTNDQTAIGLIDLFDFNPLHRRAGVGVVIANQVDRGKGFGKEALSLLCEYGKTHLNLHQLYANILADNNSSIRLFESLGFKKVGVKKEWNYVAGSFKDEHLYQLLYVH